jgi:tetratricopeptide (TPR) repeat protein
MLGDAVARFAIDDKRVYLTAFRRRASRYCDCGLAKGTGRRASVVALTAAGIEPASSLPFVFYGTIGNEDFNYGELKQLDRRLQSVGVVHHVEVFEGGHSWAPSDVCMRAIEWMELQAMKSGRRSRDETFIDQRFNSAMANASANESAGRALEAHLGYLGIAVDFKGIRDIAEAEKKAALLKGSKAVKQALSKARDLENEEIRRGSELFGLRVTLMSPATSAALNAANRQGSSGSDAQASGLTSNAEARRIAFSDLKDKLTDLKRKSEAKENSPERALARRVLYQYTAASFEQSVMLIRAKKYDLAASILVTDSELMPDNWRFLYNLACAYSLKGDKRRAIEALDKAVQKGFYNLAELERNAQLDAIREEAAFKRIVEELKQKK